MRDTQAETLTKQHTEVDEVLGIESLLSKEIRVIDGNGGNEGNETNEGNPITPCCRDPQIRVWTRLYLHSRASPFAGFGSCFGRSRTLRLGTELPGLTFNQL